MTDEEICQKAYETHLRSKFDHPLYSTLCHYFNGKLKCGGWMADTYAQDIICIFQVVEDNERNRRIY